MCSCKNIELGHWLADSHNLKKGSYTVEPTGFLLLHLGEEPCFHGHSGCSIGVDAV